jgi:2-C-methyl-D-erythritol 4-phosphate cytidylyltransferase
MTSENEREENRQQVPVVAVILAAGEGTRFDPDQPKQLVSVGKRAVIDWAIRAFESNAQVSDVVVVVNSTVRDSVERIVEHEKYTKLRLIVNGGKERADSVLEAINALRSAGIPAQAKLIIHDAVRPFVSQTTITQCVDELDTYHAVVVAEPSADSIMTTRDSGDRKVVNAVLPREGVMRVQTPQAFRFGTIVSAYVAAVADPQFNAEGEVPGGDMGVVSRYLPDEEIGIVAGSDDTMAIVTVHDLAAAEDIAKAEALSAVRSMIGKMGNV